MKIAVDVRTMSSKPSGIGRYTYEFVRELLKLEIDLVFFSDVCDSSEIKELKSSGYAIKLFGKQVYQSISIYRYFKFIKKELKQIQPDIFWEPNALIPKKLKGYLGRTMITIHDVFPITEPRYFNILYQIYFRIVLKQSLKYADIILYNSETTRLETETVFPVAKGKKFYTGYIMISQRDISKKKESWNCQTGVNSYFLYIGNMERRKGVDLLIQAYLEYYNAGGRRELYLAGKMRETTIEEMLADAIKKCTGLHYIGYVDEGVKEDLYQNCDCFIFPSRAEGFGMPVIEAMRHYKPVIASDLAIFREIIGSGIHYFELTNNDITATDNLKKAMEQLDIRINQKEYWMVFQQYSQEKLGNEFRIFINSLCRENGRKTD